MDRKLRIGVFGGARGTAMMDVLLEHKDAELVAICDKYTPLVDEAKKRAEKCGREVALFDNFDDFIKYDMDAVVLANYANEHAQYAIKSLKAGKHVLSEVLPCETMAQAVELIEAVEESGLIYAYAENYCYMKHSFEMWRRYRAGELGDVMYGEGEYIHDCSKIWPWITYGERDHWRNNMHPNYYCTHSLGPLLMMTGRRPVKVSGFEVKPPQYMLDMGCWRGAGIEMVTLDNGAVLKSIHGDMRREPESINYELYCTEGMMESGRLTPPDSILNVYLEKSADGKPGWEKYDPVSHIAPEYDKEGHGHGGSDFYPTHCFIEKILGRPDGEWSIDVYDGVTMGICGILAFRSVLAGNKAVEVPDLRDKAQRDAYRGDNACTNPKIAGDQLLPVSAYPAPEIPDSVYEKVRIMSGR